MCKYCEKGIEVIFDGNFVLDVDNDILFYGVEDCEFAEINYCPMCGRKLHEEVEK